MTSGTQKAEKESATSAAAKPQAEPTQKSSVAPLGATGALMEELRATAQRRQDNTAKAMAAQALRLDFTERKKLLMTFEKNNYSRIYFMQGKKTNWAVIYDHSAVLFKKMIAPHIGSKAILYDDKDYDVRSKIGYIRYPGMDKLVEKTKHLVAGVERIEDDIYALVLQKAVTKADFRMYLDEEESIVKTANSIIVPEIIYPELNAHLKKLSIETLNVVRKLDEPVREMVGYDLYKLISTIATEYVYASRTTKDPEPYLKNALHLIDKAHGRFMVMSWANVVEPEKLRNIAEGISVVKNEIIKQLARSAYKKAKDGYK